MTKERIIELLEIEHECMTRGARNECDRDCAVCELVQDDAELHEMYMDAIRIIRRASFGAEHAGGAMKDDHMSGG